MGPAGNPRITGHSVTYATWSGKGIFPMASPVTLEGAGMHCSQVTPLYIYHPHHRLGIGVVQQTIQTPVNVNGRWIKNIQPMCVGFLRDLRFPRHDIKKANS